MPLTLLQQGLPLASGDLQRAVLERPEASLPYFADTLEQAGEWPLHAQELTTLQVNVGKLCNQTCAHCHVDAGPTRTEVMERATLEACLRLIERSAITTVDITGGAPEMNPHFRWFVESVRALNRRAIDRCNLTILMLGEFRDLPEFLAHHRVEIVASLPCYLEENTDRQRGDGVFRRSIEALKRLNQLGYGQADSNLSLTLVYNPVGRSLPPDQATLEADYRRELQARYQVQFTRLFTITNMPISRYLEDLLRTGHYEAYMQKLVAAFNPATLDGLMCRQLLSVDWQGNLYDCDFNQMLQWPLLSEYNQRIQDLDERALDSLRTRRIATGRHCFGCTAGAGSSCGGSLTTA